MHFLLTNDDGYDAEGLATLRAVAEPLGRITVVAPRHSQSGCGHAATYRGPVRVRRLDDAGPVPVHVCHGTPADCVRLGLTTLTDEPVDWVLSGINRGSNLGVDVLYSGTVAAAREAAMLGSRAIAFSLCVREDVETNWARAAQWTADLLERLVRRDDKPPIVWNVNLPLSNAAAPAVHMAPMACAPLPMQFEGTAAEGDRTTDYLYNGNYFQRQAKPDTDVAVVFNGGIAVTPLGLDATDHSLLDVPGGLD